MKSCRTTEIGACTVIIPAFDYPLLHFKRIYVILLTVS